jgi:hypothetical protein
MRHNTIAGLGDKAIDNRKNVSRPGDSVRGIASPFGKREKREDAICSQAVRLL